MFGDGRAGLAQPSYHRQNLYDELNIRPWIPSGLGRPLILLRTGFGPRPTGLFRIRSDWTISIGDQNSLSHSPGGRQNQTSRWMPAGLSIPLTVWEQS
ncbi:MAG: hypothetical protein NZ602_15090, partial [Thermoguttaceae bacterium]|nr:hypothetical protein [Thermoguttaceae bacterium]